MPEEDPPEEKGDDKKEESEYVLCRILHVVVYFTGYFPGKGSFRGPFPESDVLHQHVR